MQIFKTLIFGTLIGLERAPVLAVTLDEMHETTYQREFKLLDADGNGTLNAAEVGKDSAYKDGGFGKADKNHNGGLSEDEFSTYKSAVQSREAKQAATDSAITTKVKSKYLIEKNFRSFKVSVETKDNIVILSGFVNDEATKVRAEQIAKTVKGVKSVSNGLVVKP